MTGYLGKTTNGHREVIGAQAQAEREDQFGPMDGEIVGYDAATGKATIQPLGKKRLNTGGTLDYPVLYDVPLEQMRSGSSGLTIPVPVGSKVRLTPQMRSTDNYHTNGDGAPSDARSFHLSDMTASLIGGDSLSDPMKNVDSDNVHLRADPDGKFGVKMSPDGKFKIEGAQGDVFSLLQELVQLLASDTLVIKYGSSAGSGHQLQNREGYIAIADKLKGMMI